MRRGRGCWHVEFTALLGRPPQVRGVHLPSPTQRALAQNKRPATNSIYLTRAAKQVRYKNIFLKIFSFQLNSANICFPGKAEKYKETETWIFFSLYLIEKPVSRSGRTVWLRRAKAQWEGISKPEKSTNREMCAAIGRPSQAECHSGGRDSQTTCGLFSLWAAWGHNGLQGEPTPCVQKPWVMGTGAKS